MISSLLHLVGLRPRVYYTLTNFRGGGPRPPWLPPSIRQWHFPRRGNTITYFCKKENREQPSILLKSSILILILIVNWQDSRLSITPMFHSDQARQTRSNSGGVAEGHPRFDKGGVAIIFYFLRVKIRTF